MAAGRGLDHRRAMTSHTTSRLTARCPEDLLAMVPVVLGFVPHDSLTMLTFEAARPFHARVDLPDTADDDALAELVACLREPAVRHRVRLVAFVVHSHDPVAARRTWRALRRGFAAVGIEVAEALRADGRRWYPLRGGGRLLAEVGVAYDVRHHPFLVQAVVEGRVTHPDRDALAASLLPDPALVARLLGELDAEATAARMASWCGDGARGALLADGAWVERLVREHVADAAAPSDADAARLVTCLQLPCLRDAAWQDVARTNAAAHVTWWGDLLRRTPPGAEAPVAGMLAFSAWLAGHGALAWCAVDVALAADPDHGLAGTVAQLLGAAVPPSSWEEQGLPPLDWRAGVTDAA